MFSLSLKKALEVFDRIANKKRHGSLRRKIGGKIIPGKRQSGSCIPAIEYVYCLRQYIKG